MKRILYLLFAFHLIFDLAGQVNDDFSDGDFTNNPAWSGETDKFTIVSQQLRSNFNPTSTSSYYLSTASNVVYNATWEFFINLDLATSGVNYVDVFLIADNSNLTLTQNGYFVRVGDTEDEIVFGKITGGTTMVLIDDDVRRVDASSNNSFKIRVTRSTSNVFELQVDDGNVGTFVSVGTATDAEHVVSESFGFLIRQSTAASAVNSHFFDDIQVLGSTLPDTQPPTISSTEVLSSTQLSVVFSEEVDESSAESLSNFSLDPLVNISSAEKQSSNNRQVVLTLAEALENGTSYSLSINGVKDLSENTLTGGITTFEYIVFSNPKEGDVLVNEFLVAPNDEEFVELFNNSDKYFNLENWIIEDEVGNRLTLPEYRLNPKAFVVITSAIGTDSLNVSGFPLFNNSSDKVTLIDPAGSIIQSVTYSSFEEGKSYELINPGERCKGIRNYAINSDGNSAGRINSNYSQEADMQGPMISSMEIVSSDTLIIVFDEPIGEVSSLKDSILINGAAARGVTLSTDRLTANVQLTEPLISEEEGSLTMLSIPDCLGNLQGVDTTIYFDEKAPQLLSLIPVSSDELILSFQERLEAVTPGDLSKFSLSGLNIDLVDETDTALQTLLVKLDEKLVPDSTYQLVIDGLEDTLGNAVSNDTVTFTFRTDIRHFEVISPSVIEIELRKGVDTAKLQKESFWVESIGFASNIDKIDTSILQVQFEKAFDKDKLFRIYLLNLFDGEGEILATPALQIFLDTEEPFVSEWRIPHPDSIFLIFNEPVSANSAVNFSNYLVEDRTPRDLFLMSDTSLFLQPPFSLQPEVIYSLEVKGVEDTLGNTIVNRQQYDVSFDTLAPTIVSISQFSMQKLQVMFNEPLDTSVAMVGGLYLEGVYQQAITTFSSRQEALIQTTDSLPQVAGLEVFLSNWSDLLGNVQPDTVRYPVDNRFPRVSRVSPISKRLLSTSFNQHMSASAMDPENYRFSGNSALTVEFSNGGYLVAFDTIFTQKNAYDLSLRTISNSSGVSLADSVIAFQFDSFLESVNLIDPKKIALRFSEKLASGSHPKVIVDSQVIRFQGKDVSDPSRYEVLMLNELPPNQQIAISWDSAYTQHQEIIPGFDTVIVYDTMAPELLDVQSDFFNQLILVFSEPIVSNVAKERFNYELFDGQLPIDVTRVKEAVYRLNFDTLIIGADYQLIVKNLTDLAGNRSVQDTLAFTYLPPEVPAFQELRITEIMADPSPVVGLPEVEYLEIWNATDHALSLSGVLLEDGSGQVPLPAIRIEAGDYLVFAESNDSLFTFLGGFPSLTNSGETISLKSIYGSVIDQVAYNSQWISSPDKRAGGYSLELINQESNCEGPANWEASIDQAGGTPGRRNSIASFAPDTLPPSVISLEVIDSITIQLTFDEYLDTTRTPGRWSGIIYLGLEKAQIRLDTALKPGKIEGLKVGQFVDCAGNEMTDTTLLVPVPRAVVFGDLMITEIMPDPTPQVGLQDGEYVELLNLTSEVLDLSNLSINDIRLSGSLQPGAYLTLIPSGLAGDEKYINAQVLSPWVGLTNARDTLIISSGSEVLLELIYDDSWYGSEEKSAGGYSLEAIDPFLVCSTSNNWSASVASEGGTPGLPNSIFELKGDQISPGFTASLLSDERFQVHFDEPIHLPGTAWSFSPSLNAQLDTSILQFPSILDFKLLETPSKNQNYTLTLGSISDCYGNTSEVLEVSFLVPELTIEEIYVSEILFDPLTGGDDFVELYNGSEDQYLELSALSWQVGEELRPIANAFVLPPNSYVALTENRSQLLFDYPLSRSENILEVSDIPSLSNEEGQLILVDNEGRTLDSVYYRDDFHSSLLADVEGVSLERMSFDFPATAQNNWSSASSVEGFATPGRPNSQSLLLPDNSEQVAVEPRTFVPGSSNPAYSSFTTIAIRNEASNRLANVWVVNGQGKIVKTIAQGILLGTDDFVTWDGSSDAGSQVAMGQYLVVIEFYGGNTNAEVVKKPVTVGAQF